MKSRLSAKLRRAKRIKKSGIIYICQHCSKHSGTVYGIKEHLETKHSEKESKFFLRFVERKANDN